MQKKFGRKIRRSKNVPLFFIKYVSPTLEIFREPLLTLSLFYPKKKNVGFFFKYPFATRRLKKHPGAKPELNVSCFMFFIAGCLLDSSAPRGPPDVPPRNPAMSRLNGRLPGSHAASDHERDPDLEPSCLVRTPSGNFYNIPSEYANGVHNR